MSTGKGKVKWWGLATTAAVLTGCVEKSAPPLGNGAATGPSTATTTTSRVARTNASTAVPAWPPTKAQPKLRTLKLYAGPKVITAELALSEVEVGTGMMFRTSMAEDEGMLFVFAKPHRTSFYMRNTTVPLSAAYIDSEGTILEIVDLMPLVEKPVEASSENVQYVLEMNQGWFKRHNVGPGMAIATERGSLAKTFGFER
jgi:uncharacterized membrane protein (UPF0127 family)